MRILFAISVIAFVALVWASVSAAQHIRQARRTREMIRKGIHAGPLEADTADLVPWLAEDGDSEQTAATEEVPSPAATVAPAQNQVAPPPPAPEAAATSPLPAPIPFPLSSQRAGRINQPRSDSAASPDDQPSEAAVRRDPVPIAPPRRPEWTYNDAEQPDPRPAPRFRDGSR